MKKLFAFAIAVLLVVGCVFNTAAVSTATPDEAKTVKEIQLTNKPDKLVYTVCDWVLDCLPDNKIFDNIEFDDIDFEDLDIDDIVTDSGWQYVYENAYYTIIPDLSGAEMKVVYTDGTAEDLDPNDCTTSVVDAPSLKECLDLLLEEEVDYDELSALLLGKFTVKLGYMGASTEYDIEVVESEYYIEQYELVEYNNPSHRDYYLDSDVLFESYEYEGDVYSFQYIDKFDFDGMTVTLRNTTTGEIETYTDEDIDISFFNVINDESDYLTAGTYTAYAYVYTKDDEGFSFDYEFNIVDNDNSKDTDKTETDKTDNDTDAKHPQSTPNDSTVNDAVTTTNTSAVQTGSTEYAIILFGISIVLAGVMLVAKKKSKIK